MKDYKLINENKRKFIDPMTKLHKGCVMNTHNSPEHEMKKAKIFYNCQKDGLEVYAEVPIKGTDRIADIIILDLKTPIIYEVAATESKASIAAKKKDFEKLGLRMIEVRI